MDNFDQVQTSFSLLVEVFNTLAYKVTKKLEKFHDSPGNRPIGIKHYLIDVLMERTTPILVEKIECERGDKFYRSDVFGVFNLSNLKENASQHNNFESLFLKRLSVGTTQKILGRLFWRKNEL